MFGRVPKHGAPFLGTRPNISESHSEISTRVPLCIAAGRPEDAARAESLLDFDWKYISAGSTQLGGRYELDELERHLDTGEALGRTLTKRDTTGKALSMMLRERGVEGCNWGELFMQYDCDGEGELGRAAVLNVVVDQLKTCLRIMQARRLLPISYQLYHMVC